MAKYKYVNAGLANNLSEIIQRYDAGEKLYFPPKAAPAGLGTPLAPISYTWSLHKLSKIAFFYGGKEISAEWLCDNARHLCYREEVSWWEGVPTGSSFLLISEEGKLEVAWFSVSGGALRFADGGVAYKHNWNNWRPATMEDVKEYLL